MAKHANITAEVQGNVIQFTLANGSKHTLDMDKAGAEMQAQACIHGFVQKVGDDLAGRDKSTHDARVKAMIHRLTVDKVWKKVREKGAVPQGGLLVRAMMKYAEKNKKTLTMEDAAKKAKQFGRAAILANQDIANIYDALRYEQASKKKSVEAVTLDALI